MFKPVPLLLATLIFTVKLHAQDSLLVKIAEYKKERGEIITNKNIYKHADLLAKNHHIGVITQTAYRIADSLDKLHPKFYFSKADELIKQFKLNDAAFIYYLGSLRYRYYNAANPYFKRADDGMLFSALESAAGKPVNMYLTANFDNFTAIVKKSSDWFLHHDYSYFSKSNNSMEFLIVADGATKLLADLEQNKNKYSNEWKIERLVIEQNFEKQLKEIDDELRRSARE